MDKTQVWTTSFDRASENHFIEQHAALQVADPEYDMVDTVDSEGRHVREGVEACVYCGAEHRQLGTPSCVRWNNGLGVKIAMTDTLPGLPKLRLLIVVRLEPERHSVVLLTSMG